MTAAVQPPLSRVATTEDAFLGDRLRILQPATGYRAGVDAVLLAASVAPAAGAILDCGAGVGTVGLCIAARCPECHVTLVERQPALLELARQNIVLNKMEDRVSAVGGDLLLPASHPGAPDLAAESFDVVLANPPFHDNAAGTRARDALKHGSHAMDRSHLAEWLRYAARMTKPAGRVMLIHKADALPLVFDAMKGRFGGLTLTPIHPFAGKPAIRVIVTGTKGSRAPLTLRPPVVLHEASGAFAPYVGRILREGAPLVSQPED
ncbi:MAG: tRNA1(Val) (adenine(37)-N6)-methyltransferase [Deltaproteobacteria bacterium]